MPANRSSRSIGLALFALFIASALGAKPSISLEAKQLTATGLTPHGQAALLAVSRERVPWMHRIVHRSELLQDDNGDGQVSLRLETPIADNSLWILVDLSTGTWAAATPSGSAPPRASEGLLAGVAPSGVAANREQLNLMVARPGEGAWHARYSEEASGDGEEMKESPLRAETSTLRSVGPLAESVGLLRAGDLLVVIDPSRLDFAVHAVTHSDLNR